MRQVDRRGRHEGVDARAPGVADGGAGAGDVALDGAGEARHRGARHASGDLGHGLEVALGGDREAGLDDVDPHVVEQVRDLDLVLERHGGAGALLAVAQGGVEDQDAVGLGAGA